MTNKTEERMEEIEKEILSLTLEEKTALLSKEFNCGTADFALSAIKQLQNENEQLEQCLARAWGLLRKDNLSVQDLKTKETVIKEIETYFKKKYDR